MKINLLKAFYFIKTAKPLVSRLILFILLFSISFFQAQTSEAVIQVHGEAVIFGDYYTESSTTDKTETAAQTIKQKTSSVVFKNKKQKEVSKKALAATEDIQKEKLKKIVSQVKISLMKFYHKETENETVENSSAKKTNLGTISAQYVFASKHFELEYFTLYIYRDLYIAESPKFSKEVSNLISGRAPPKNITFMVI